MPFLEAEWRRLAVFNYEVAPELLEDLIPGGTELDLWKGRCYVSLVGFLFKNTRIWGIPVPFHGSFEEVNLRFYVKRELEGQTRRGVVFIKELVPKTAVTLVAKRFFNEPYETVPMDHSQVHHDGRQGVSYEWTYGGTDHRLAIEAEADGRKLEEGSKEAFISEHYYGYTKLDEKRSNEYEVDREPWTFYEVLGHELDVDFALLYGERFEELNRKEPSSVMLFEGSGIALGEKRTIHKRKMDHEQKA
jgi:uncharacterized protein YqjF (DUF2071 family)